MMDEFMDALKRRARRYVIGLGVGAVAFGAKVALHATADATGAVPEGAAADSAAADGAAPESAAPEVAGPERVAPEGAVPDAESGSKTAAADAAAGVTGGSMQGPSLAAPPITQSREAALRATAATNVHTAAMTDPEASAATTASTAARTTASPRAGERANAAAKPMAGGTPTAPAAGGRRPGQSVSVTVGAAGAEQAGEVAFVRETFGYAHGGRRDPFVSLMANGELRPMIADLRLVAVAYDPNGRNSVAIMRDVSTKEQYRVKVGQTLGRMRAARIQPKEVVFTIEEFGLSRQAVLTLSDSTTARTK